MKVGRYNIEIEELNDVWLLRYQKSYLVLSIIYLLFTAFFVFGTIGIPILSREYWEPYMWVTVLMSLGGVIGFACGSVYAVKRLIALRKEIRSRKINAQDKEEAQKASKRTALAICCAVIIGIIFIWFTVRGEINAPRCVECGKKGLYSEYGYCYSCYREVYENIKENGR